MSTQNLKEKILKNKKLSTTIATLICAVVILTGISTYNINLNNDLIQTNNSLNEQYEQLNFNYNKMNADYKSVKKELENYQDQQDKIDELEESILELQSQLTELKSKNDSLFSENNTLKSDNESLKSENNSLKTKQTSGNNSLYNSGGSSSTMVWIPATGSKYHNKSNCGNMNPSTAQQVSKSTAESWGYTPCKKCY